MDIPIPPKMWGTSPPNKDEGDESTKDVGDKPTKDEGDELTSSRFQDPEMDTGDNE